jgi:hypothetical protein
MCPLATDYLRRHPELRQLPASESAPQE